MAKVNFTREALGVANPLFARLQALLPNLQGLLANADTDEARALRQILAQDTTGQERLGAQTVAGAFGTGTRRGQSEKRLQRTKRDITTDRANTLSQSWLSILNSAPVQSQLQDALRRAQEPGTFGRLAGLVGGTALNLFGPGLAGKLVGSPLTGLFGAGGSSGGGGGMTRPPINVGGFQLDTASLDQLKRQLGLS